MVTLCRRLKERCPLVAKLFDSWLFARESSHVCRPLRPILRTSVDDLPIELLYGVMVSFLAHSGYMLTMQCKPRGRFYPGLYVRKRLTGGWQMASICHRTSDNQSQAMEMGVEQAWLYYERRLKYVSERKEVIEHVKVGEPLFHEE